MNKIISHVKNHQVAFLLFSIVLLGTLLRVKGLTFQSHWLDELYSADFSDPSRTFKSMLKFTLEDVHPPIYQSILWIWYKIFGYTEFSGRSLSAIFGSLGIVAIYFLGKEFFNKKVGLYAAALVSINEFLIHYSQETRSYSLFFLIAVLSYMYLYRTLKNPNKKNIFFYWLTTILMFYVHYFSFFLVLTQSAIFIMYMVNTQYKKYLLILALLTSLIFSLSIVPLIPYILAHANGEGLSSLSEPSPFYFIHYIYHGYFSPVLSIIILLIGIISFKENLKNKLSSEEKNTLIVLFIWISLGFFLPYLKSILSSPLLSIRYTIAILPAIILAIAYTIWKINGWKKHFLLTIFILYSIKILFTDYYISINKHQFREVLFDVAKHQSIPIYEAIPYNGHNGNITNHFQTYSKMLDLDLNIRTDRDLKNDYKAQKLPKCFWIINAHFARVNKKFIDSELINKGIYKALATNSYKGAKAVLLSFKNETNSCYKNTKLQ